MAESLEPMKLIADNCGKSSSASNIELTTTELKRRANTIATVTNLVAGNYEIVFGRASQLPALKSIAIIHCKSNDYINLRFLKDSTGFFTLVKLITKDESEDQNQ